LALASRLRLTVRIADETRLLSLSWPGAAVVGDFSKGLASGVPGFGTSENLDTIKSLISQGKGRLSAANAGKNL